MSGACVLVRDPRIPIGGFESWVETLARGLPSHGIETIVLRDPLDARGVLNELERLAADGKCGVFFTMGYDYINRAGLNLRRSPWIVVPVLHGQHPSAFDWIVAGPPAKVVALSPDFARICRAEIRRRSRWFRAVGRVVVIPHGVRVPPLVKPPFTGPLRVVAVSRLDEDVKRPFDYLRIAELAPEMTFTIAGSGPAFERMRAEAPPNVTLLGAVPHDGVVPLLLAADVLISTSESEAFSLSIAEAMACGCAVVATDIPGNRQLVRPRTGRRVPVGDIQAFANALRSLDARSLGQAGRALIEREFSEEKMLERYARLIRGLRCRPDRTWRAPTELLTSPDQLTLPPIWKRW